MNIIIITLITWNVVLFTFFFELFFYFMKHVK